MIRLLFPPILFTAAIIWAVYEAFIIKNKKKSKEILSISLFFGAIWGIIY